MKYLPNTIIGILAIAVIVGGYMWAGTSKPVLVAAPGPNVALMREQTVFFHGDHSDASGVIVSSTEVLTAAHAVRAMLGQKIDVEFFGGEHASAIVEWVSKKADVAKLSVNVPAKYVPAEIECKMQPIETPITVVGNPVFARWVVTHGLVATDRPLEGGRGAIDEALVFTAIVAHGSSGGPVFDDAGKIVGVVEALMIQPGADKSTMVPTGLNMAVPAKFFCGAEMGAV